MQRDEVYSRKLTIFCPAFFPLAKTSWFIPAHSLLSFSKEMEMVRDAGHEIGMHGSVFTPFLPLGSSSSFKLTFLRTAGHMRTSSNAVSSSRPRLSTIAFAFSPSF